MRALQGFGPSRHVKSRGDGPNGTALAPSDVSRGPGADASHDSEDDLGGANAVEQPEHLWVVMARLRNKIEPDPANPRYLLTEPFVGYRFVSAPASP
jgi:hypothetical protein